mmetsp:Transcript_9986/g.13114  ORF Transcript_9986/g.13114 Transcript_9986/m.13114 type:complete len:82 (+) Transcript_9986:1450-1695(+)
MPSSSIPEPPLFANTTRLRLSSSSGTASVVKARAASSSAHRNAAFSSPSSSTKVSTLLCLSSLVTVLKEVSSMDVPRMASA